MLLLFDKFKIFKKDFITREVGIQGRNLERVIAEKVKFFIKIGCFDFTPEEFNKLYKLILFKENEFRNRNL